MPSKPISRRSSSATDLLPLFEYSTIVNSSLDLNFILGTVLLTVMGKMLVPRGLVLLKRETGDFEVVNAKGIEPETVGATVRITKSLRRMTYTDRLNKSDPWVAFFRSKQQRLLVPIMAQGRPVGLLTLGERMGGKKYSETDRQLVNSLVNLSAAAIEKAVMIEQLREVNRDLARKFQELNTLFDLSKEFNVVLDTDKVLRLLAFSLMGQIGVNRYAFCLAEHGKLRVIASRLDQAFGSEDLLKPLCSIRNSDLVENLARSKRFSLVARELQRADIAAVVPMKIQNEVKGVVLLGEKLRGGPYTKTDLEFLYSVANLAIISIENARLFQEGIEKQKLEDELAIARDIQQGLLPRRLPEMPGFDVAAVNIPSRQVGGDYYDVIQISRSEYIFAIGDVSGKGTPAALLMASVQASLRAFAPMALSLTEATGRINDLTCLNTGHDKFITFFWGALDAETRQFRYVNAGHNPPFLLRAGGEVERLDIGGIIIGFLKTQTPYPEGSVTLNSGDVIVMFTDGVSEAMNVNEEDFTEQRLEEVLKNSRASSAEHIILDVRRALEVYTRGTPQSDDLTMLVLKAI